MNDLSEKRPTKTVKATQTPSATSVSPKAANPKTGRKAAAKRQRKLDLIPDEEFELPPHDLLEAPPEGTVSTKINKSTLQQNARLLESVLKDFGVHGEITKVRPGPVVTLYELEPAPGTKTSRVISLGDDSWRLVRPVCHARMNKSGNIITVQEYIILSHPFVPRPYLTQTQLAA